MFTALNFHTENSSCDMVLHLRPAEAALTWAVVSALSTTRTMVWRTNADGGPCEDLWGAAGILGRGYGLLLARCGVRVAGRHHGCGHRLLGRCENLEKTGKEGMGNISGPSFDSMN